jgi:hypothetical protein
MLMKRLPVSQNLLITSLLHHLGSILAEELGSWNRKRSGSLEELPPMNCFGGAIHAQPFSLLKSGRSSLIDGAEH